ncbi:MAG: hypothetical protein ACK5BE_02595 [Alphaproteobacteria bacterium]|jgi:hypothetical protein
MTDTEQQKILVLTQGILQDGRDFYAYALIPEDKYMEFAVAEKTGSYNLSEFGEIKKYEIGTQEPTTEVKQEMERLYGAKTNFEEEQVKQYLNENLKDEASIPTNNKAIKFLKPKPPVKKPPFPKAPQKITGLFKKDKTVNQFNSDDEPW